MLFSYEVSTDEFDGFVKTTLVEEHQLPTPRLKGGTNFSGFELTAPDRNGFYISYLPEVSGQVVNQDEAELVEAGAIVSTRHNSSEDLAWYLPPEVVEETPVLPELRQAFYEGESYEDREADYKYHYPDGQTSIAVDSSNPVQRLDDELVVTAIEELGGMFPQKWLLETESGEYYYLRERSGSIRLQEDAGNGEEVFQAFIGREHPGTLLHRNEVLNIISAVDYITIVDDYDTEVPEEAHEAHWGDISDAMSGDDVSFDDIVDEEELDEIIEDLDEE